MFHEETRIVSEGHGTSRNDLRDQFQRCNSLDERLDLATKLFQFALAHENASLHGTVLSNGNVQGVHQHLTKAHRSNADWKVEKLDDSVLQQALESETCLIQADGLNDATLKDLPHQLLVLRPMILLAVYQQATVAQQLHHFPSD